MFVYVDPISFRTKIYTKTELLSDIKKEISDIIALVRTNNERIISRIKKLNDIFLNSDSSRKGIFSEIALNRFPDIFVSFSDKMKSTSIISVNLFLEKIERISDTNKIKELCREWNVDDKEHLKEIVRLLSWSIYVYTILKNLRTSLDELNMLLTNTLGVSLSQSIINSVKKINEKKDCGEYDDLNLIEQAVLIGVLNSEVNFVVYSGLLLNETTTEDEKNQLIDAFKWIETNITLENIDDLKEFISYLEKGEERTLGKENILPLEASNNINKTLKNCFAKTAYRDTKLLPIYFDIKGIQKLIRGSEYRRYLAASSSLLETTLRRIARYIAKITTPESILIGTGGTILAIIPPVFFRTIKDEIIRLYENCFGDKVSVKGLSEEYLDEYKVYPYELVLGKEEFWCDKKGTWARNFGGLFTLLSTTAKEYKPKNSSNKETVVTLEEVCNICFSERVIKKTDREKIEVDNLEEKYREYRFGNVCSKIFWHYTYERSWGHFKVILDKSTQKIKVKINDSESSITRNNNPLQCCCSAIAPSPEDIPVRRFKQKFKEFLEEELERMNFAKFLSDKSLELSQVDTWDHLGFASRIIAKLEALEKNKTSKISETEQHRYLKSVIRSINENDQFDIAFIYGDGDNFGTIKAAMSSLALYSNVSFKFTKIIRDSVLRALAKVVTYQLIKYAESKLLFNEQLEKMASGNILFEKIISGIVNLPFDIIYIGGDDILLVLDAGFLFLFLKHLRKSIQNELGALRKEYKKGINESLSPYDLGVSLGIAVIPNKIPIYLALDVSHQLIEYAKKRSKSKEKQRNFGRHGAEISVAIQRFTSLPSSSILPYIFEVKKDSPLLLKRTAQPFLGCELFETEIIKYKGLIGVIRFLLDNEINPNDIERFFKIEEREPSVVKLYINYAAARMVSQKTAEFKTKRKSEGYKALARLITNSTNGTFGSILFDIANYMKIVYNSKTLLEDVYDESS